MIIFENNKFVFFQNKMSQFLQFYFLLYFVSIFCWNVEMLEQELSKKNKTREEKGIPLKTEI